jgi:hypothetical protein
MTTCDECGNVMYEDEGCQHCGATSSCTGRSDCYAVNIQKARSCIGLLNSMIRSGESHSDTSCRMLVEALDALDYLEQHNAANQALKRERQ